MNSTPVYPAYALVAMAREANRDLVHALRVNSAPLAVNAARRRAMYMALAREKVALVNALHQIVEAAIANRRDLEQLKRATRNASLASGLSAALKDLPSHIAKEMRTVLVEMEARRAAMEAIR